MPQYKYTYGIIRCTSTNEILLLNRQKHPWMGRWNGVGGKFSPGETPMDCIIRETQEETGLVISNYQLRGVMTWFKDGENLGGMYVFTADLAEIPRGFHTPKLVDEGILDWKKITWVCDEKNSGIVDNLRIMLQNLFHADEKSTFKTLYESGSGDKTFASDRLVSVEYLTDSHHEIY
ncbi:hypothetical protein BABINDRAFT_158825 [Babjeviella inositovora NRRL Y-12698]|uniref:Nudix hydrolase domain-containing protein n=1 Tax=Babjeviella inositovora NRRL Y-12698 TaxID=984486 RepID=A0A1E3QWX1_9ASCO|nr:uncharacterized protein BABINDRAFT_158825 [Babjeviella inositovora NRRL Y-12698]ODQ82175.1 hypothetical protein BABINDRAFT_158825 [Babjeviella inositovora NRRL Y-12698]